MYVHHLLHPSRRGEAIRGRTPSPLCMIRSRVAPRGMLRHVALCTRSDASTPSARFERPRPGHRVARRRSTTEFDSHAAARDVEHAGVSFVPSKRVRLDDADDLAWQIVTTMRAGDDGSLFRRGARSRSRAHSGAPMHPAGELCRARAAWHRHEVSRGRAAISRTSASSSALAHRSPIVGPTATTSGSVGRGGGRLYAHHPLQRRRTF